MQSLHPRTWAAMILRALIHSNLYVALCATSMVWATRALHGLSIAPTDALSALVFCATILVYNLDRAALVGREDEGSARHDWYEARKLPMLSMSAVAALGALFSALQLPPHLLGALVPLGALSLGYSAPVVRWRGRWLRLKDVPGLKIFLIAAVWSMVTAGLPLLLADVAWGEGALWGALVERALFIFVITLPFDVRDLARDRSAGVLTIPGWLGVEATRQLAMAGALVWCVVACAVHGASWALAIVGTTAVLLVLLSGLSEEREDAYYTVWMEGMMWAHAALVLVG